MVDVRSVVRERGGGEGRKVDWLMDAQVNSTTDRSGEVTLKFFYNSRETSAGHIKELPACSHSLPVPS